MTDIQDDTEKPNSSTDETKGVFEKYEMKKLNKYAVIATIAIINLASLIAIYQINNSWNVILNPDLVLFATIKMGIIIALLSAFFLYFNKKINFLLDERTKKLG